MKKRSVLFSLLVLAVFSCRKNNGLEPPTNTGPFALTIVADTLDKTFTNIFFVNERTGYLIGEGGVIYKTTDSARAWTAQESNTDLPLYGVFFLNEDEGFVVGGENNCEGAACTARGPIMLHTTDGGQTWQKIEIATSSRLALKSVFFPGSSTGFAVGDKTILSTHDHGATWQETNIQDLQGVMQEIQFTDSQNGLIICTFGKLLKTTDGGKHWTLSAPFPKIAANSLSVWSEDIVYSAGYTAVYRSNDFGDSWTRINHAPVDIFKLVFASKDTGYAFGRGKYSGGDFGRNYGAIYYTTDGGYSWKGNDTIRASSTIYAASFTGPDQGYAVSKNIVLKITNP